MIDIQHDSPVPIHEQIVLQIMAHVAAGDIKAGARLAEYRAFAQQLLTNPQVVARAYGDLEWEGVVRKGPAGAMVVTEQAAAICRLRLQEMARERLRQAVAHGLASGLCAAEVREAVERELSLPPPLSPEEVVHSFKKSTHGSRHRTSQSVQNLSGQTGGGSSEPDSAAGGDIRPAGG